jgi:hypothetical protein
MAVARRVPGALLPNFCRAEEHVVRAAKFECGEIQREFLSQFFAIPSVGFQELLIVVAAFVPSREE